MLIIVEYFSRLVSKVDWYHDYTSAINHRKKISTGKRNLEVKMSLQEKIRSIITLVSRRDSVSLSFSSTLANSSVSLKKKKEKEKDKSKANQFNMDKILVFPKDLLQL